MGSDTGDGQAIDFAGNHHGSGTSVFRNGNRVVCSGDVTELGVNCGGPGQKKSQSPRGTKDVSFHICQWPYPIVRMMPRILVSALLSILDHGQWRDAEQGRTST